MSKSLEQQAVAAKNVTHEETARDCVRVAASAHKSPGGYTACVTWYVNGRESHQYVAGVRDTRTIAPVYETPMEAVNAARETIEEECLGRYKAGAQKVNRMSISWPLTLIRD